MLLLGLLVACGKEPPELALRNTMAGMQAAAEARDVDALLEPIADDFAGPGGMDRQMFRRYVMAITLRNRQIGVQLGPLDVKMFGERATVSFTAATTGGAGWLPDRARIYQVETNWRMQDGDWKLMTARWEPKL